MTKKFKFVSNIAALPTYTQLSVLYPILGSLNSSAINIAAREVQKDLATMAAADKQLGSGPTISIDKYNELINELRQHQLDAEWSVDNGIREVAMTGPLKDEFVETELIEHQGEDGTEQLESAITKKVEVDRLSLVLQVRSPLVAMFNAAQANLPQGDTMPDFSIEETFARQLAREYAATQATATEIDNELVKGGYVTIEELAAEDKKRFEEDQNFKKEFKFLLIDKVKEKEPLHVEEREGDEAFLGLGHEYGERMCKRILPKLEEAKRQQIMRRTYDSDASSNIILISTVIKNIKSYVGESEAEAKLRKLQALDEE